jgi:hypothetical protein
MGFLHTKAAQARKNNVRLEVTRLEDRTVPSTLAAEFAGQGVWRYMDGQGWKHLTAANATLVACASDGYVVAEFKNLGAASGVWRFSDTEGWRHLTTATNATILDVDTSGDVVGAFQGWGVWRFEDKTGWQQLTPADASLLAIDRLGHVVGEFTSGVWLDNGSWVHLTADHASALEMAGNDYVVGAFQDGVYRWMNGQQQHISFALANSVGIDDNGYVVGSFNSGIWRLESFWQHLNSSPVPQVWISSVTYPGEVVALTGNGIWGYTNSWFVVTFAVPTSMDYA